jgi:hypothetical protein
MSSTDGRDELLQRFFEQTLVPLAREARTQGRSFFPRGPDPEASSYYTLRTATSMTKDDFEITAARTPEEVGRELRRLWADDPLLAPVVDDLLALMPRLEPRSDDDGDVSPFIYVMF